MKIKIVSVGSLKRSYVKEAVSDYVKRISRYLPALSIEIKEETYTKKGSREAGLRKEADRILRCCAGDYIVLLADNGRQHTSVGFSNLIGSFMNSGRSTVSFVIGGPFGLHPSVSEAASSVLSLSPMTLPHELALLVLSEQVYRALSILKNEPYSH